MYDVIRALSEEDGALADIANEEALLLEVPCEWQDHVDKEDWEKAMDDFANLIFKMKLGWWKKESMKVNSLLSCLHRRQRSLNLLGDAHKGL